MLDGENDYQEFLLEWHRRAGKDMTFFQLMVAAASKHVGDYAYTLPFNVQAKKVILNANTRDSDGVPCSFMDFIPPTMFKSVNFSDGIIKLNNGSNIYVIGADNYDSNVGMNLSGVVLSEWSICDPKSYEYFSPMLEETRRQQKGRGWCLKCWTPRGKNHAWKDRNNAQKECNKDTHYFSSIPLGVSTDFDGSFLYTMDDFQRWINQGKDENLLRQEWLLDYEAAVAGVVFSKNLAKARQEGRIRKLSPNPKIPILTFWDIGVNDETTIWFMQPDDRLIDGELSKELHLINYYENRDEGLDHYVKYMKDYADKTGCKYGTVYFPHDGKNKEWIAGERRHIVMGQKGFDVFVIDRTPATDLAVNQTKTLFNRFVFDEEECERGLECLENYVYKVAKDGTYGSFLHNWASNGADSLRQIGQYYADKHVADRHDTEKWDNIQEEMSYEDSDSYDDWNDCDWDD